MKRLLTADGVSLAARHLPSASKAPATVVLVHGFAASKDHPDVVAVAEAIVRAGFDVIAYDARGHHESAGLCTLGDSEQHDVAAAVAQARTLSDRVVTVGASMGGIAVLRHAGTDTGLAGTVAVSAPAVWELPWNPRAMFAAALSRTRLGRALAARHLGVRIDPAWSDAPPPAEVARSIRSPLAVIHGRSDRMIPSSAAHQLIDGAGGATRLDIVEDMGHAYHPLGIEAIVDAVRWIVGSSMSPGLAAS